MNERKRFVTFMAIFLLLDEVDDISLILKLMLCKKKGIRRKLCLLRKRLRMERLERDRRISIDDFYFRVIERCGDVQFHENLRMKRATFDAIFLQVSEK